MIKPPCELMNEYVFPAVRSLVVEYLYRRKKLNQLEISRLLGISQSSVSRYLNRQRGVRGYEVLKIPGFKEKLEELVERMLRGEIDGNQLLCEICSFLRNGGYIDLLAQVESSSRQG